jgi:hypothetical protein
MNVRQECESFRLYVTQGRRVTETSQSAPKLVGVQHKQLNDYELCTCKLKLRLHFIIGNMSKRVQRVVLI